MIGINYPYHFKPYMSGGGNRMGDGRDMSLVNARKVISQVASRYYTS